MFIQLKLKKNEDYDDSIDNGFVARLIAEDNPLDFFTHLLNQK